MFDLDFLKTCTAGFDRMTDEAQNALRGIVQLMQKPDGLFPDRSGRGDLYYTLFGLCLAYVSEAKIDRGTCEKTLEQAAPVDLVHRAALAHSRNLLKLMKLPRAIQNLPFSAPKLDFPDLPDSAFPQGDRYSPYSCFLRNDTSADLSAYRLPDGLYSNLKGYVSIPTKRPRLRLPGFRTRTGRSPAATCCPRRSHCMRSNVPGIGWNTTCAIS